MQSTSFSKEANARYDVAIAKADAEHKVATEKCDSLPSAAQGDCKDTADANLKTAKARAAQGSRRCEGFGGKHEALMIAKYSRESPRESSHRAARSL